MQESVTVRNAKLDAAETAIGASPIMKIYSGAPPANCAAAASGTLLASGTLPANWMADAAAGSKALAGSWVLTGQAGAGTGTNAGHYRIYESTDTTCHKQGYVTASVPLATNGVTAANSNVLNFAATTGVAVGMNASGVGVVAGSTVIAVDGTTVTLSHASTAGVGSAVTITFGGDVVLDNINIANSQVVTVSSFTETAGNA